MVWFYIYFILLCDTRHVAYAHGRACDPPVQSLSCERRSRPCLLANTRDSSQRTHANLFWFHQHVHGRHAADGYQRALARGSCRLPADSDAMRGERSRALPAIISRPDGGGVREGLLPKKCRRARAVSKASKRASQPASKQVIEQQPVSGRQRASSSQPASEQGADEQI